MRRGDVSLLRGGGRCIIEGPGSIIGRSSIAISSRVGIVASNIDVDDARIDGTSVRVEDVRFVPFRESGINGVTVRLRNMTIGSSGVIGNRVIVQDVVLAEHSGPLIAAFGPVIGRDVTATGGNNQISGIGVSLRRFRWSPGAPPPPQQPPIPFTIRAEQKRVTLFDSNADVIVSELEPRLVRSTCLQSFGFAVGTWGVCANDP